MTERSGPKPQKAFVIADVRPGDGEAEQRSAEAEGALDRSGVGAEVHRVEGPAQVRFLARQALTDGHRLLVCIGDDDAIAAVIDGMMGPDGPIVPDAVLGVMAAHGTCDFVRTFGIPADARFAAERLATDRLYPIDVPRVTFRDRSGAERTTHIPGIVEVGLDAVILRRASRLPRWLGRARSFLAFWTSLATYRIPTITVRGERREFRGKALGVVVGNCQYARGGLRVSPRSFPGDGFLDLLIWTGPRSNAFTLLPKMFQGEHLPNPEIQEHRARHITIDADRPLAVHGDGVALGTTPVTIELLREAVTLRI